MSSCCDNPDDSMSPSQMRKSSGRVTNDPDIVTGCIPQPRSTLVIPVPNPQVSSYLSDELDDTASLLDLLLGVFRDETGLDDEWFVDTAFAQLSSECLSEFVTHQLEFAEVGEVDNGNGTRGSLNLCFWQRDELSLVSTNGLIPACHTYLVDVDGRAEGVVFEQVVVTHTDFTKVTRMVLISASFRQPLRQCLIHPPRSASTSPYPRPFLMPQISYSLTLSMLVRWWC